MSEEFIAAHRSTGLSCLKFPCAIQFSFRFVLCVCVCLSVYRCDAFALLYSVIIVAIIVAAEALFLFYFSISLLSALCCFCFFGCAPTECADFKYHRISSITCLIAKILLLSLFSFLLILRDAYVAFYCCSTATAKKFKTQCAPQNSDPHTHRHITRTYKADFCFWKVISFFGAFDVAAAAAAGWLFAAKTRV